MVKINLPYGNEMTVLFIVRYTPNLMLDGVSVKVTDPQSRENCLKGYTFSLESRNKVNIPL